MVGGGVLQEVHALDLRSAPGRMAFLDEDGVFDVRSDVRGPPAVSHEVRDAVLQAARVRGARLLRVAFRDEADFLHRLRERGIYRLDNRLRVVLPHFEQAADVGSEEALRVAPREAALAHPVHHVAVAVGVRVVLPVETLLSRHSSP